MSLLGKKTKPRKHKNPRAGGLIGYWKFICEIPFQKYTTWKCECTKCGNKFIRTEWSIRKSKQCRSCCSKQPRPCRQTIWAKSIENKKIRYSWCSRHKLIKSRCYNKKDKSFRNYGGRGIKIESSLLRPDKFIYAIKSLPGWDNPSLSLDRINNDGHYETGNLRMATRTEQANNIRPRHRWGERI